ncbi:Probable xyloglucan galactosyltransferase GT14 [Linum perenne]
MLKNCHSLDKWLEMCPSISNLGLGTRVKDHGGDEVLTEEGWYATYQFILEVIFHHRSVELVQWLRNQPEWNNNGMWGRDHFFVSGRIAWDLRRDDVSQWGSKLMMLPESMNMTLIRTHERRYLYAFVGAPRANMTGSIRGHLMEQCIGSTMKKCKLLNCQQRERCENPVEVMRVFQDSVFCLQPPGDSPTRRSIFDSILAGCIPVFFHPFSAYGQYLWHLPRNYSTYSVYIPEMLVREGRVDIEKRLLQVTEEEIVGMRKVVIGLIPKVIYGDPRSKSMGYEDAFGIAIKGVLERIGNVRRRIEEGNDLGTGLAEPDGWKLKLDGIGRDHDWDKFF